MSSLHREQRLVIVVGLGAALYVLGQWLTSLGSTINSGWVAYAPSSKTFAPNGLQPWARLLIWLALIGTWTVSSFVFIKSDRPRQVD